MLFLLIACASQVDIHDNTSSGLGEDVRINAPYALGAEFALRTDTPSLGDQSDWTMVIEDEGVIEPLRMIQGEDGPEADVRAASVGQTRVDLLDGRGQVRVSVELEVREAASLTLDSRLLEHTGEPLAVPQPQLIDSWSVWPIHAFDADGVRLAGLPPIETDCYGETDHTVNDGGQGHEADAFLKVQVLAEDAGPCLVEDVDQTLAAEIELVGVPAEDIVSAELIEGTEVVTGNREIWLVGRLEDGTAVLGLEGSWVRDGVLEEGEGDRYVFPEDTKDDPESLVVSFGDEELSTEIQGGEGSVDPASAIGCASTGLAPVALASMLSALLLRRRKRVAQA